MREATKVISASTGAIRYSRNNGRDYMSRLKGKKH